MAEAGVDLEVVVAAEAAVVVAPVVAEVAEEEAVAVRRSAS